ncbi:iron transporter [Haloarcula pelagica]|uniref:iron transporter n=2 Tax=Haloarcula TaxID=2237 RepID=UPI0024C215D3|nr:iron transporter [Halomicroarcula sp. YJ-61-S]
MDRRSFLRAGSAGALAAVAGCLGGLETQSTRAPPLVEDRPDAVYYPTHLEGMEMVGMAESGDYAFGLMYSYPHRFWNINGSSGSMTPIGSDDDVHLMSAVWDPETGMILPDTGLTVEIYQGESLVSQEAIYPMLSQPMGFHYGANFGLDGDGDYRVVLSVGAMSTRRTGGFADRFGEPTTAEIPFTYSQSARDELMYRTLDNAGDPGAVEPMAMEMIPDSLAPSEDELPGTVRGSAMSNDARLVVTTLDAPPAGIDAEGSYVAVSARTRYNEMVIPAMGLSGTLESGGETVYDGRFQRTLDPDLGYHYGAVVDSVATGDELALTVTAQPQTARHEGYEMAFGGLLGAMPDVSVTFS